MDKLFGIILVLLCFIFGIIWIISVFVIVFETCKYIFNNYAIFIYASIIIGFIGHKFGKKIENYINKTLKF
jgi:hypothetical protein